MTEKRMEARSPRYLAGHLLAQSLLKSARVTFRRLLRASEAPTRLMAIEEQITIGPKKTLMLLTCAGRRFLFATAGDSITTPVEVRPLTETGLSRGVAVIGYVGEKL